MNGYMKCNTLMITTNEDQLFYSKLLWILGQKIKEMDW